MEILKFPDKRLFTPTKPVTVFGEELSVLLNAMWDAMIKANGIGLSANQVGLDLSMFVMKAPDQKKMFIINPEIVSRSEGRAGLSEGCLSASGEYLTLFERAAWVQLKFQNETGKVCSAVLKGIYSVCAQHEIDHLEGKSFLESKSIPRSKRKELSKKYGLK